MKLWRYTTRELLRRPLRSVLTLSGIVIGVAALLAIGLTIETTRSAYRTIFETLAGRASLEIVAAGDDGVETSWVQTLQEVEGVKAAVPLVQVPAVFLGAKGRLATYVLGVDPEKDGAVRDVELEAGQRLGREPGALLDAGFARANGLGVGDHARVLTRTGAADFPIVGLLKPGPISAFNGGAAVMVPLELAQEKFALNDRVGSIQIVVEDGADEEAVRARVAAALPPGLLVHSPAAREVLSREALMSTEQALSGLSVMSLVAGAFIILNTFLMNLGERRRQLALMRALGATRRQVQRWLLREAVVLGAVGTVLGLGLGWVLARGLTMTMGTMLGVELTGVTFTPGPVILALLIGPGIALAATYVPARRAGREPPLHGIVAAPGDQPDVMRLWPVICGAACLCVVAVVAVGMIAELLPVEVSQVLIAPGMGLFLVGAVLVVPPVMHVLLRFLARILDPILGMEGRLGARHLERRRLRTSLTAGVLFIAVVVSVGMGNQIRSSMADLNQWYERTVVGDWFIRGIMPPPTMITTASIDEDLEQRIEAIEGVDRVSKLRFLPGVAQGVSVMILAYTFDPGDPAPPLELHQGRPEDVLRGLLDGGVVIGTRLGQRLGLGLGDALSLHTRTGPREIPVVGVTTEYTSGGMALYLDWKTAKTLLGTKGVDAFCVTAAKGEYASVDSSLTALCDAESLLLQSNQELKATIDASLDGLLGFMWTLLLLVFVVASLGTVNTLTMNVLEQTREIGVLRAVAMTRAQVRKVIRWQALLLGLVSLLPGLVVGLAVAWLFHLSTYPMTGIPVDFRLNWGVLLTCAALALVTSIVASLLPARRAARLPVFEALHYE